ncbi:EamA family transporter RarD [Williamsia sp. CHRR-6]|uniref:EamA family transporter RarD n=1 Tax=Williamsia sp. CHRR-6 TaxID=2835871 RepID=UPI001BDAEF28|nr:EamA family transporter RarD [Williamsia sp. CHRR-6]MBT0567212.1 EamA family transporter RarD [Williamsia sp. CHRR-6]
MAGLGAYGLWGLFPAFFEMFTYMGAGEILAHRIVWTCLLMVIVLAATGHLRTLAELDRRAWLIVAVSSAAISVNWGVYVYAVVHQHVVEAALGYFINPLVSVLFGVVFFAERINRWQSAAVVLAVVAVVVLTVDYGRPPVISLLLAVSFAFYGAMKKIVGLDPRTSLAAEGVVGTPVAVVYLVVLAMTGTSTALSHGTGPALLLVAAGPVTAVPLLLFGIAAQRVPLVTLGLLQYLTPGLQLLWGVAVNGESMPASRWIGFGLIWCALAVFSFDAMARMREGRSARPSVEVVAP